MNNLSNRMQLFLKGVIGFLIIAILLFVINVDSGIIASVYLGIFYCILVIYDLNNNKRNKVVNNTYDDPSIVELMNFIKIWNNLKTISQTLGFLLLILSFLKDNMPFFMVFGALLIGSSLLFETNYSNDIKKIRELQYKELH